MNKCLGFNPTHKERGIHPKFQVNWKSKRRKKPCPWRVFDSRAAAEAALKEDEARLKFSEPSPSAASYGCEYEYDSYGPASWSVSDDFNVYEGLELTKVDAYESMALMFDVRRDDLPEELRTLIAEKGWDDKEAWYITTETDYYGETVKIVPPDGFVEAAQDWYWKHDNAKDSTGAMDYAREKGVQTTGLTPIEAVKTALREENNGRIHPLVEDTTHVYSMPLRVHDIEVPNQERLNTVEPREPKTQLAHANPILGVVVMVNNRFVLVDGYHRYKWVSQNPQHIVGRYLILTNHKIF